MERRGQLSVFVIVAIVIVGIFLIIVVYPRIKVIVGEVEPNGYLKDCITPVIDETLPRLTAQGGYLEPTSYVLYQGDKVQYLCYTAEDYKPCIVQQPLLVSHVESEIKKEVEPKARACLDELKALYERKGYSVSVGRGDVSVGIVTGKINVEFNAPFTVTKDNTQVFRKFQVTRDSELYDLLAIATNIIQFESTLGDSETSLYLQYYPDLKIEKLKKEADTIYTLTNVVTNDKFRFATRSLVWPSGYGVIK